MPDTPTFLMTDGSHFEVSYKINPWMTPDAWRKDEAKNRKEAREASASLSAALRDAGARVVMMDGAPGSPDMVFPANAAVVLNGRALVARFRYPERQGEERHFLNEFARLKDLGALREVAQQPRGIWQEGAGDCIWDASRQLFWAGFGPRSSFESLASLKDFFGMPMKGLELVSGRFYHLDTCFVPLSGGEVLYYPPAFSKLSLSVIRDHVPADFRNRGERRGRRAICGERRQYQAPDRDGGTDRAPHGCSQRARLLGFARSPAPLHHVGRRRLLHDAPARS